MKVDDRLRSKEAGDELTGFLLLGFWFCFAG
jgi:hypothetical protein